jgi:hypothetical protein
MKLAKGIRTDFVMSYPAMSVYEFEHFKEEAEVLEYWKSSSIYIICQRPVLFFDDMTCTKEPGVITTKIRQRDKLGELSVVFDIHGSADSYLAETTNKFLLDLEFYDKEPSKEEPFRNVAGIRLLNDKEGFLVWLTPARFIFEYLKGRLSANVKGDIHEFLGYTVHYIGQAQNQSIWQRLTGHEKLSKVLALEHPFIEGEFSPYELSLIFLKLDGFSEDKFLISNGREGIENISGKELDDNEIVKAMTFKKFDDVRHSAVNDVEAYLINLFEPKYNKILFKDYPNVKNGLKSIGFELINHQIVLFATLATKAATFSVKITPIFANEATAKNARET